MAKMDSLRWIPMIVQAYQAAKTKINSTLPMINIPSGQVNSDDNRVLSHVRQQPVRMAKKMTESRGTLLQTKKLTSGQVSSTNRLIRELRAANKKLNRLESIQKQLKEMESMFAGLRKEIQQTATEMGLPEEQVENPARGQGVPLVTNPNFTPQKENGKIHDV
jgi:hypothetical protein